MKSIEIREKIIPFSHTPGTECIVPLSNWIVSIYPALLRIGDFLAIPIRITGPVEQFLVQLDLERDCVWFSGIAREGHYRCQLSASEEGLTLTVDRAPEAGIEIGSHRLKKKQKILLATGGTIIARRPIERISFGNWKAQDWDLVRRRNDLREIIPVLYRLGQKVPSAEAKGPMLALLQKKEHLQLFCLAAFSGILVPHLGDVFHQGIGSNDVGSGDPIGLLSRATYVIRSCLIQETQQRGVHRIHILPSLPSDWVAGRSVNLQVPEMGAIDLEWTKRAIRRMVIHAQERCEVVFIFPKEIKAFHCDGRRMQHGDSIVLKPGKVLIDRFFQK